jgi:hypothetical protein
MKIQNYRLSEVELSVQHNGHYMTGLSGRASSDNMELLVIMDGNLQREDFNMSSWAAQDIESANYEKNK